MSCSLAGLILLTLLVTSVSTLTPQETCDLCQVALRTVYAHFRGKVLSRRQLTHQFRHECNRHFNYRRRCLLLMKHNYDLIYRETTDGSFMPIETCMILKECKQHNVPTSVNFDFNEKSQAFALVGPGDDTYDSSE